MPTCNKHNRGFFISVEGIDGAGKTTHITTIVEYLESRGHDVIVTRDPGGTPLGENIRKLVLSDDMEHLTELLLFFASRQELLTKVIIPNLSSGITVVTDRFVDASFAYQHGGRGLPMHLIAYLMDNLSQLIMPDITLLFDVDAKIARTRTSNSDRIEVEDVEFFTRVQQEYLKIANNEPHRVKLIDTEMSIVDTKNLVENYLSLLCNHSS
jgi:dTMP kinase